MGFDQAWHRRQIKSYRFCLSGWSLTPVCNHPPRPALTPPETPLGGRGACRTACSESCFLCKSASGTSVKHTTCLQLVRAEYSATYRRILGLTSSLAAEDGWIWVIGDDARERPLPLVSLCRPLIQPGVTLLTWSKALIQGHKVLFHMSTIFTSLYSSFLLLTVCRPPLHSLTAHTPLSVTHTLGKW